MAKIKMTKNELKKQKDDLSRFLRYLPTLELKKKQLLLEITRIRRKIEQTEQEIQQTNQQVDSWVDVFAENIDVDSLIKIRELQLGSENIAGIDIPVLQQVLFDEAEIDPFATPLWVDRAIEVVKSLLELTARLQVAQEQQKILRTELAVTIQRIKLFEKVKIPDSRKNIHIIQIFLADQNTAQVVRGKIAKAKIEKKRAGSIC